MACTKSIPCTFMREEPNEASLEAIRETEDIFERGDGCCFKADDELFDSLDAFGRDGGF